MWGVHGRNAELFQNVLCELGSEVSEIFNPAHTRQIVCLNFPENLSEPPPGPPETRRWAQGGSQRGRDPTETTSLGSSASQGQQASPCSVTVSLKQKESFSLC